jgi:RNA polymerase sigma factor (sigma-70 family)
VPQVVEHLFRHEAGRIVSSLARIFGMDHLGLVEDVVQEALVRALQTWPFYGVPKNPSAWIVQVARNLALDIVRREKVFRNKEIEIAGWMDQVRSADEESAHFDQELKDDGLRMMFVCCHPVVPQEAQVALALKTLCGFSVGEIARSFLASEAAIAKRLTRATQKIREAGVRVEVPGSEELARRLSGVLQTLYLLFNEGHKASSGDHLIREELCHEAIRLASQLAENAAGNRPETHALLALMLFNAARLPARVDTEGNILLLKEQNRALWDRSMIARGMFHFAQSAAGDELTEYHLQAGIAACHCSAANYQSTDWRQILLLYDHLMGRDRSPVVALNRAVAVAEVHGPQAGLKALAPFRDREELASYYLLYAVLGEFEAQLEHFDQAIRHFEKSLKLAGTKSEQVFLSRRLRDCQNLQMAKV